MLNYQKGFTTILIIISAVIVLALGAFYFLSKGPSISNPPEILNGISGNFDVSSDESNLVFPYKKNGEGNLYISKIDGTGVKIIPNAKNGVYPKFSPDNKRIVFTTKSADNISVINVDGTNYKKFDVKDLYVKQAVFDPNGEKIYFLGAASFENYSPIARKANHDFDIYTLNLNDSKITNNTNNKYYSMSNLAITNNGDTLTSIVFEGEDRLYVFWVSDNFSSLRTMRLKTNKKIMGDISVGFDNNFEAVYTTPEDNNGNYTYDLYRSTEKGNSYTKLTNLKSKVASPVLTADHKKVLFLNWSNWPNEPPNFELMEVGIDGNGLKKIDLAI